MKIKIRNPKLIIEHLFNGFSLVLLTGGMIPFIRTLMGFDINSTEGDVIFQIIFSLIFLISILLIIIRQQKAINLIKNDKFLILLLLLTLLSIFWSPAPGISMKRIIAVLGTSVYGYYLASRYNLNQFLNLISCSLAFISVLSLVTILLIPEYGISTGGHAGEWRGIFTHKNHLGRYACLGALVFIIQFLLKKYRILNLLLFLICLVEVVFSSSQTALIIFLIILLIIPFFVVFKSDKNLLVSLAMFILLALGSAFIIFIKYSNEIFNAFGRDLTFTGRTLIWETVYQKIQEHYFLGYGYGGFWLGWFGESSYIWRTNGWEVPHAHNGILELWLQLGLIGVALFLLSLIFSLFLSALYIRKTQFLYGAFPLVYLLFFIFNNATEIGILVQNNFLWVVYISVVIQMRESLKEKMDLSKG